MKRRTGFTLLELLVVIVVIGLVAALLLSAVQSARATAKRTHCAGNLKQLGIALASYAAAIGSFPASGSGKGYSIHVVVLPYLEQGPLFDSINMQTLAPESGPGTPNGTSLRASPNIYLCPSDPNRSLGGGVGTNYAGSRGVDRRDGRDTGAFSFWEKRPTQYADFQDGTNSTVAFSEWVLGPVLFETRDPEGSIFETQEGLIGQEMFDAFVAQCRQIDPSRAPLNGNDKGRHWLWGGYRHAMYNHNLSINEKSCMCQGLVQEGAYSASSRHAGGVNTLFVDGHVRFMTDRVSPNVWRAIGTRDGGEVVNLEAY